MKKKEKKMSQSSRCYMLGLMPISFLLACYVTILQPMMMMILSLNRDTVDMNNEFKDFVMDVDNIHNDKPAEDRENEIDNNIIHDKNRVIWGAEWDAKDHTIDVLDKSIEDKLTVVITTFKQPICLERMILLMKSCPAVAEIRVNWYENQEPTFVGDYFSSYDNTPVVFDKYPDKISYRFHPRKFRTNGVFSVDVDTFYSCEALTKALATFNEYKGEARAVGFHGRFMRTDTFYRSGTSYFHPKYRFNTVFVTKGGITHKDMFTEYFSPEYKALRDKVDEALTGEDMLMSFIMDINKTKILFTCAEVHNICHVYCTENMVRPLGARPTRERKELLVELVNFFGKDKVFRDKFEGEQNIIWQKGKPEGGPCMSIYNLNYENTPPCTTFCEKNLICPSNVNKNR